MDSKPVGRDKRIRLQATNNFLRVKSLNKGWDKVHERRVEALQRQLQRSRVALQREAVHLEGEVRSMRRDVTYLDDRDFQIKMLKTEMEKAKERKPIFLHDDDDAVSTAVLWSPRQQTSAGHLPRRQGGDGWTWGEGDGEAVSDRSSTLMPLLGSARGPKESLLAPCQFYKAQRRPPPFCRHFPCQPPTAYFGHDLDNDDISAQKSLASLGINPALLSRSARARKTPARSSSFHAHSATDSVPTLGLGVPESVSLETLRPRMTLPPADVRLPRGDLDTRGSCREDVPVDIASQQRYTTALNNDDDDNYCGNDFREDRLLAAISAETGDNSRLKSSTLRLRGTTSTRTARRRTVSFSEPLSQEFLFENEQELEHSSMDMPFPGNPANGVSTPQTAIDTTDSKMEASRVVAPERTNEIMDDDNPFFKAKARSTAQRKTMDRLQSLALAMDNQRRRNEENRPTPRETQYGQATPLRVLLKEGNPSVYAKMSGLCL